MDAKPIHRTAIAERRLARITAVGALATGTLLFATVLGGSRFLAFEVGVRAAGVSIPESDAAVALLPAIARCESGGDLRAVSADGRYRGKYQFDAPTWATVGGSGDPATASEAEQDHRAQLLLRARGEAPWPVCSRQARTMSADDDAR